MLIICVYLSELPLYKNFIWDIECTVYLANVFSPWHVLFLGLFGFLER